MYKFLYGYMFLLCLDIYLGVELLSHVVALCLSFRGIAKLAESFGI